MSQAKGYAAQSSTAPLAPFSFERREPRPDDVVIDIQFCGVCHSDLHQARDEWGGSLYPMVPGHEIVGTVKAVGSNVTRFKVGDPAAVGVVVDSCRVCEHCKAGLENYCKEGMTGTYNAKSRVDGSLEQGGYSNHIVTDQRFVHSISPKLDPAGVAPLLCAGITTYSPLRHWKVGKGHKVGVVGLGGLGHMALKFAHSFGASVTLFTTSASKADDAKRLGADEIVISKDPEAMKKQAGKFDFIIDTVSASHDINPYVSALKLDGTYCMVGIPDTPPTIQTFNLLIPRRNIAGSAIGGTPETQEMLDYCAEKGITADVEVIPIQQIEEAYKRMLKSDVKYRFVIDMSTLS
jgi:uncharacterized zinc-type alcohol dehydrogenase-like protein